MTTMLPPTGPTILVIDASSTLRACAARFLEPAGYRVLQAGDALAAMILLAQHQPALILCSRQLARLDGLRLCALIRRSRRHHLVPVLLLSDSSATVEGARAALAGATSVLHKPFGRAALLSAVRVHVPMPPESAGADACSARDNLSGS